MSNNNTFKPEIAVRPPGNATTNDGMMLAVELRTSDPSDLATHFPRAWINLTSNTMKWSLDGTIVKTITAT